MTPKFTRTCHSFCTQSWVASLDTCTTVMQCTRPPPPPPPSCALQSECQMRQNHDPTPPPPPHPVHYKGNANRHTTMGFIYFFWNGKQLYWQYTMVETNSQTRREKWTKMSNAGKMCLTMHKYNNKNSELHLSHALTHREIRWTGAVCASDSSSKQGLSSWTGWAIRLSTLSNLTKELEANRRHGLSSSKWRRENTVKHFAPSSVNISLSLSLSLSLSRKRWKKTPKCGEARANFLLTAKEESDDSTAPCVWFRDKRRTNTRNTSAWRRKKSKMCFFPQMTRIQLKW